jgi:hypothetical protein
LIIAGPPCVRCDELGGNISIGFLSKVPECLFVQIQEGPEMGSLPIIFAMLSFCSGGSPESCDQEQPCFTADEKFYYLQFNEKDGVPVEEFIDLCKEITGCPIKYDEQQVRGQVIWIYGIQRIKKDRPGFYAYYESLLAAYGYLCNRYGPEESPYFFTVSRIKTGEEEDGPSCKTGRVIPRELIEHFRNSPSQRVTTTLPLNSEQMPSLVKKQFSRTAISFEVLRGGEDASSFAVVTGTALEVWGVARLLGAIDSKKIRKSKPPPVLGDRERDRYMNKCTLRPDEL